MEIQQEPAGQWRDLTGLDRHADRLRQTDRKTAKDGKRRKRERERRKIGSERRKKRAE